MGGQARLLVRRLHFLRGVLRSSRSGCSNMNASVVRFPENRFPSSRRLNNPLQGLDRNTEQEENCKAPRWEQGFVLRRLRACYLHVSSRSQRERQSPGLASWALSRSERFQQINIARLIVGLEWKNFEKNLK